MTVKGAAEPLSVRLLVFKACLVAAWSDGMMSAGERRELAALIEQLAEGEEERAVFRQHSLAELAPDLVLDQLRALPEPERRAAFERCLEVLAVHGTLSAADRGFLSELRRACGMGRFAYWRRLWALRGQGVGLIERRRAAAYLVAAFVVYKVATLGTLGPTAAPSGRAVRLRPPDASSEAAGAGLPPELVYRYVADSFATVEVLVDGSPRAEGSAFVVGDDDAGNLYLVTNRHVARQRVPGGADVSYRVRFLKDAVRDAVLDFVSERADLALLRLPRPAGEHPSLTLRPRAALEVGERVYALGSPLGLKASFTGGMISALRDSRLQTDVTVDHGSSGGPLVDSEGRLCGVVTSGVEKKNYSFALYADAVLEALAERGRATRQAL